MHLGLLIYGSLDTVSGGFLYDRNLVKYLESRGDRVEVISLPWRAYPRGLADNLSPALLDRLSQAPFNLLLQDELAHPSLFLLNRRLKSRAGYPVFAIVHHLRCREAQLAWKRRASRWLERRYLASVDGYVCVSSTTRSDVERLVGNGRPAVVAHPGGDALPGDVTDADIAARCRAPGPLSIIFVGNLIPRKGLHVLVAALHRLPPQGWRLAVVGSDQADPAYARAIRRQVAARELDDRVTFLGNLPPDQLARQLQSSQVLCVPSSYEGFGIVYLEAMRFGLPAIASTAGAAHEIITPGQDGFLVPPEDAAALAGKLNLLLGDRDLLLRLSRAARRRFRTALTWEESAASVRRFLLSFLDSASQEHRAHGPGV